MIDRFQSHMQAMQMFSKAQDITANNLANINTPGFKGDTQFQRILTEQVDGQQVKHTVPMQSVNLSQGELEPTGNTFDFGINGEGFFMIEKDGQANLSRDGRFHLDPDGYLKDSRGGHVMGHAGRIHIPEYFHAMDHDNGNAQLEVAKDGTIRLNDEVYDQIRVVRVDDPSALERRGNAYFSAPGAMLQPQDENSEVVQGYFEKGNVQALEEMTGLMKNMQMFEAQQRAMRTTDELLSQATNTLGRF
ncbi:flagellar hook-basal body protein [Natronogracilivirga saccharolytica]|uniref:Flagellar hook-basal body complex protein n=1 Tax=Natronogracilivirga saccharolytica TaxID=2812953 RepID=A0A8J7RLN0_9BACT|nr:flagellar hook-basal body complex protein [Natronogracilivirga saccharolytica]MBP3191959.1 flagellar hook-basal body complex protein [Natronogracilivirga saccharolytica]